MKCLSPTRRSLQRFNFAVVDHTIAFILGSDHVCYTSWGTKIIVVDGIPREFPLVMRKISRTNRYGNYTETKTVPENKLKRSSFFSLPSNMKINPH
jgi:hypothetical protein